MSESTTLLKTPSELLAEKISNLLVEKGFVLSGDAKKLEKNLATGKLKSEDWRLAIEKAIDKENKND